MSGTLQLVLYQGIVERIQWPAGWQPGQFSTQVETYCASDGAMHYGRCQQCLISRDGLWLLRLRFWDHQLAITRVDPAASREHYGDPQTQWFPLADPDCLQHVDAVIQRLAGQL